MGKVAVVYWSGTGNTQAMAEAVAQAADGALFTAAEFGPENLAEYDAIAFGCPSMGSEELEDSEFLPMFESVKGQLADKKVALFGSYGMGAMANGCAIGRRTALPQAFPWLVIA